MALIHEFVVIKKDDLDIIKNNRITLEKETTYYQSHVVVLHDDLIQYFWDYLEWLEPINPYRQNETTQGLFYYARSLFDETQSVKFKQLISSWHSLFSHAPSQFELKGEWSWIHEKPETGSYEKIQVEKMELLSSFKNLIKLCEQVEQGNGKFYLMHCGI